MFIEKVFAYNHVYDAMKEQFLNVYPIDYIHTKIKGTAVLNKLERIKNRCYEFSHKSFFSPPDIYNFKGLELKKDGIIIGSRTSMGSAVNAAFIFGCSPIVLLANDCSLDNQGKRYFWQYWNKENQPYRILGTKFNFLTQNFGFSQKDFIDYWRHFSEVNKNKVEIINCSDTPKEFNFFPKMKIEEVLKKYGE